MSTLLAEGGFKDTAFSAQAVFRRVMDAFSRPGTIVSLDGFCAPPPRLGMATGAFLLALSDYDTPVWLEDPDLRASCAAWLGFQTGAPLASEAASAAFAVLAPSTPSARWAAFAKGESAYPDRSTTLILPVSAFAGGPSLILKGPGIEHEVRIAPLGLVPDFVAAQAANRALFPLGHDLLLTCGGQALALPRTTMIEEG